MEVAGGGDREKSQRQMCSGYFGFDGFFYIMYIMIESPRAHLLMVGMLRFVS